MRWLRLVVRVGILWLVSIVVTVAGLELAHRSLVASGRGAETQAARDVAEAVSRTDEQRPLSRDQILTARRP